MSLDLTTHDFIRDTNGDYSIGSNSIVATTQRNDSDGYVAWDHSSSPIPIMGGWQVEWTFKYTQLSTSGADSSMASWTGMLGGWQRWLNSVNQGTGSADAHFVSAEAFATNTNNYVVFVRCGVLGVSSNQVYSAAVLACSKNTQYYARMTTDSNASTYGDIIFQVYTDAARTTLLGTETVSLTSLYGGLTFDYFQAHSSSNYYTSNSKQTSSTVTDYNITGLSASSSVVGALSADSAAMSGSATHSAVGSYDGAGSLSTSAATISGAAINAGGGLPPAVLQSSIKEFFTDSSGSPLMAGVVKIKILQDATNYSYDFSDNTIKASASVTTLQGSLTAVDATYWAGWYEIDVITSNLADGSYTFYIEETTTNQHRYSSFTYKAGLVAQAPTASENADAVWAKTLP